MDQFQDGHHVRLRSRVHGTFLRADKDWRGVSLHPRRASLNTAWTVTHFEGVMFLRNAAYGRYLAITDSPAPFPHRGFRCAQLDLEQSDMQAGTAVWTAIVSGYVRPPWYVRLSDVHGRYLRANGRYLQWNTGVTVDDLSNSNMFDWEVEHIPEREGIPDIPMPVVVPMPCPSVFATMLGHPDGWTREIRYVQAHPDGTFSEYDFATFRFRGRSVAHLRVELAFRVAILYFTMCIRAGHLARCTPLLIDLPCSSEPINIVIVKAGTPGYAQLQFLDVDAEEAQAAQ